MFGAAATAVPPIEETRRGTTRRHLGHTGAVREKAGRLIGVPLPNVSHELLTSLPAPVCASTASRCSSLLNRPRLAHNLLLMRG